MAEKVIKIFFDGSFNSKYKTAAFISKDDDRRIAAFTTEINVKSSIYAEYQALYYALQWAHDTYADEFETHRIEIYGDCKPAITNVTIHKTYKSLIRDAQFEELIEYHGKCRALYEKLKRIHNVSITWIPRCENNEVDEFSRSQHLADKHLDLHPMLIKYLKFLGVHDIQKTVVDYMKHFTGKSSYRQMSSEQLNFFYNKIKQLIEGAYGQQQCNTN
jgi:ribonuclease HI